MNSLSRRAFLSAGGAFILGFGLKSNFTKGNTVNNRDNKHNSVPLNAYIEVYDNDLIVLKIPFLECGQGIYTAAAMLLAEELDVRLEQVKVKASLPDIAYIMPQDRTQLTLGSYSTGKAWLPLRDAGASARIMFLEAASKLWNLSIESCRTEAGKVYGPQGESLSYGQLVLDAVKIPVPEQTKLKDVSEFKLIGKTQPRLDTVEKINGQAIYGIDIKIPNMKIGLVHASPFMGGKLKNIDDAQTKKVKKVTDVLYLEHSCCVVADHYWAANKGLQFLIGDWDYNDNPQSNNNHINHQLHLAMKQAGETLFKNSNDDMETVFSKAVQRHKGVYQQPLLAHAAMEPLNCTVYVQNDQCEIWTGTQIPLWIRDQIAQLLGLPKEKIIVYNQYVGGSFGRRMEEDYIIEAVQFAKQVNYPLKVIWSREEDFAQDHLRPAYVDYLEAGWDKAGNIIALFHHIVGPDHVDYWEGEEKKSDYSNMVLGLKDASYQFPFYQINYTKCDIPSIVPGWWHGQEATRNLFAFECFIDELAEKQKKDPIVFRNQLLGDNAEAKAVLQSVSQMANWGQKQTKSIAQGVAFIHVFDSYLAVIVEAEITTTDVIRLHRVFAAIDCGFAVNPDQVCAQIESGLIFGLSTALYNEAKLQNGKIVQRNFNQYRVIRMNEAPVIEVKIIQNSSNQGKNQPGGIGELGTIAAAPALANALAAITHKRYRSLPLVSNIKN